VGLTNQRSLAYSWTDARFRQKPAIVIRHAHHPENLHATSLRIASFWWVKGNTSGGVDGAKSPDRLGGGDECWPACLPARSGKHRRENRSVGIGRGLHEL